MVKAWRNDHLATWRYAVGEVFALRCGDIHPHPGPNFAYCYGLNFLEQ